MALQNRLDYGSCGFQVPMMPHVPKSAKRKRSVRRKAKDNPMCAFDLLATVAGQLLVESGTSADQFSVDGTSNSPPTKDSAQHEQLHSGWPCKAEGFGYISTNKSALNSGADCQRQVSCAAKGYNVHIPNTTLGHSSAFKKPNTSAKEAFERKLKLNCTNGDVTHSLGTIPEICSFENHSPSSMESCRYELQDVIKTPLQTERRNAGNKIDGIAPGMCSVDDSMDLDTKPSALVSSDSSFEVPPCGGHIPRGSSSPKSGDCMELPVNRDDDENSSGCTNPSTSTTKAYVPQQIRDRRIRKLLVSRHRKVSPSMLRDGELSDSEMKSISRNRNICYTRQRTQRCSFKRRKLYEHRTVSSYGGALCSEGTPNLPVKGHIKVETSDSLETLHGAHRASSSTTVKKPSYGSEDFHVKFSIKSFKVPELFIDIPENATVASLKKTVMEAVTDILGGGLRVGVLLQGKKVRDDSKTLLQTGISRGDQLGNLGFTLEPKPTLAQPPLSGSDKSQLLLPSDSSEPLTRILDAVSPSDQGSPKANLQPPLSLVVSCPESDHDSVLSPADISSLEKTTANSKALVPVPSMAVEALAVVPLCKSRRSELVQRRIRRPFSVNEVEALVQAVEKLGTGRWRDVKLRAFDNAKHRTYVDLKDKWKTLVHTARISPQQRRGEPVPQELLDRVLAAHAYWSQQQAMLPTAEACLLI